MIIPDDQIATREVKDWCGLHLLHFQSSTCSQKVRILLREKQLDWTSHPIDLAAEKHVTPWFIGINPRGVVPVLVHDGVVHVESNDIMEHLDSLPSSAAPFFPIDRSERESVKQDLALEDGLHVHLRNLTMGFIMPQRLVKRSEATLQRWEHAGRNDPKRALEIKWWRDFARDGIPRDDARASVSAHRDVFERLDARLEKGQWLMGDRLSVLDISWFITTLRLSHAGYPLSQHPRLADWHARLEQRPTFSTETRDPFVMRAALPMYQAYRRLSRSTLVDVAG